MLLITLSCTQAARRIEITSSTKNAAKRADKLTKLKAGKAVGPKKDKKVKKVGCCVRGGVACELLCALVLLSRAWRCM